MQRAYHRLLDVLEYIPGLLIGLIAVAIGIDVFLRNLGFIGFKGMLEIIEYALFGLTFIGITPALRRGAHVSVDMLLMRARGRVRQVLSATIAIISIAISATVCFSAWTALVDAWGSGAMVYKNFIFPEWILFAVILAGMALFTVELIRQLVHKVRDPEPDTPHETIAV